jgi:hypothetical protein
MIRIGKSNRAKDIVPILADLFLSDYELSDQNLREYQLYYISNLGKLGQLGKYLNNQMSDYEILSIEKGADYVKFIINDLNYTLMAEELVRERKLDIPLNDIVFPIILKFQGINSYSVNEVSSDGDLVEINDHSVFYNAQILFDQLIYIDEKNIELGFSLWKYIGTRGKNFLLLISANLCQVSEAQIDLFNKIKNGQISNNDIAKLMKRSDFCLD